MGVLDEVFAALYDPIMGTSERAGLADQRLQLLADLSGEVVEIGPGTGLNLPHYPAAVDHLTLVEPTAAMVPRLRRRLRTTTLDAQVVLAPAERIPVPDASTDHVVSTLVLCSVDDLDAVLAEIRRVLKPGGHLVLLEHVDRDDGWHPVRRVLEPVWKVAARGCHLTYDTRGLLERAGFDVRDVRDTTIPAPKLTRPAIIGTAVPR